MGYFPTYWRHVGHCHLGVNSIVFVYVCAAACAVPTTASIVELMPWKFQRHPIKINVAKRVTLEYLMEYKEVYGLHTQILFKIVWVPDLDTQIPNYRFCVQDYNMHRSLATCFMFQYRICRILVVILFVLWLISIDPLTLILSPTLTCYMTRIKIYCARRNP